MEEPVRIGLEFPRSGQRLTVQVPRHWAETAQARAHFGLAAVVERIQKAGSRPTGDGPRQQP